MVNVVVGSRRSKWRNGQPHGKYGSIFVESMGGKRRYGVNIMGECGRDQHREERMRKEKVSNSWV